MKPLFLDMEVQGDYKSIALIDVETENYVMFSHREASKYTPMNGEYQRQLDILAENFIVQEDKAAFLEDMYLNTVKQYLNVQGNSYAVSYKLRGSDTILMYQTARFFYLFGKKDTIVMVLKEDTEKYIDEAEKARRLRLKEERFNFLIRTMCENFIEVNVKTGRSLLTTPNTRMIAQGQWDEQIAWFAEHVVVPDEREEYLKNFELANLAKNIKKNSGLHVIYCTVEYADGLHNYMITNTLIRDVEGEEHIFSYAQDITQLKHQEQRNREAVVNALATAERASIAKGEFLSRMSHEIRTPLNAIMGMTELAKYVVHDSRKCKSYLEKICSSSSYLLSLINDILDKAKIESGKLAIAHEPFSLSELVEKVRLIFQTTAQEKQVDFLCRLEVSQDKVYGDFLRSSQVLTNLLGNAFKFTPAGGSVRLEVCEAGAADGQMHVRCSVKDTGIGIREERQVGIFESFEQAERDTLATYGGSGLGLAISYKLVGLMGGELRVNSRLGEGAEFFFTLPLTIAAQVEEKIKEARAFSEANFFGIRLLVVEDNELNAEVIQELLRYANIETELAVNGREAVKKFRASAPGYFQAILMDVLMPVMDGLEATLELRALPRADAKSVPIIGMSANAFEDDIQKALHVGMSAYTAKPVEIKVLLDVLRRFF